MVWIRKLNIVDYACYVHCLAQSFRPAPKRVSIGCQEPECEPLRDKFDQEYGVDEDIVNDPCINELEPVAVIVVSYC